MELNTARHHLLIYLFQQTIQLNLSLEANQIGLDQVTTDISSIVQIFKEEITDLAITNENIDDLEDAVKLIETGLTSSVPCRINFHASNAHSDSHVSNSGVVQLNNVMQTKAMDTTRPMAASPPL